MRLPLNREMGPGNAGPIFYMPDPNKARVLWTKGQNMFSAFFAEIEEVRKQIGDHAEFARWCIYELHIPLTAISRVTSVLQIVDGEIVKANLAEAKKAEELQKRREREQREAYAAAERARKEQEKADAAAEKARQDELERQRLKAEAKAKKATDFHKKKNKKWKRIENDRLNAALAQVANTNVVPFQEQNKEVADRPEIQLVKQIKAAIMRSEKATEDWQEAQVELATLLVEARRRYPAHQKFAHWLDENEIKLNSDDRAALLKLGQNPAAMRVILQNTSRRSIRLIWGDTQKQLPFSQRCENA